MAWIALRLHASAEHADALADALIELGALSVTLDDADAGTPDEAAQFAEPGLAAPRAWAHNILTVLLDPHTHAAPLISEAAALCGMPTPEFSVDQVQDQDWVRATQAQFEPICVHQGLWIVPSWCTPPEPTAINISIDPGLAFGTGSHATTRLVLRWLANTISAQQRMLDYGCGSGILAIAAARLGAAQVLGVDIDPQALIAANENALKNQVTIPFVAPADDPGGRFDVVVANILANPLIVLAPLIESRCLQHLALSGILQDQAKEVMTAYAPWFALKVCGEEDGWVLLAGTRHHVLT
jgi:ribosomal protein L11 methyltransferase